MIEVFKSLIILIPLFLGALIFAGIKKFVK